MGVRASRSAHARRRSRSRDHPQDRDRLARQRLDRGPIVAARIGDRHRRRQRHARSGRHQRRDGAGRRQRRLVGDRSADAGQNTITASTTDPGGIRASAQITVAYQPPATSPPAEPALASSPSPPPPVSPTEAAATIAKSGFNGRFVWLRLTCHPGLTCAGRASDTAKLRVTVKGKRGGHRRTRIEQLTVATGGFSISPGATATIKLKMTNSAKALVARLGKLFTTLRVTLNQPGNSHTPVTASLVIRKPPARHNRH